MANIMLHGSAPYLSKSGLLKADSLPYLMLNLPFLCNYRCLKCCNYTDAPNIKENRKHLGLSELQILLEEAGSSGFKVLILAGEGETFLNSEFKAIIKLASINGLLPYVFTNGTQLDPDNINFLAEHKASLIISLDSIQSDRYARLTGKGNLEKVLSNIQRCRSVYTSLQEQTSFGKVVSLAINTVVTRINMDEIENIKQFCGEDIVFVCNRPTRIGLAEKNWGLLYGAEFHSSEVDATIEHHSKMNGPLGSTADNMWCAYMKNGVSVGYDGSFLVCAYATETAGLLGKYKKGRLKQMNKLVMDSVNSFYSLNGHSRCILRHPQYNDFLQMGGSLLKG